MILVEIKGHAGYFAGEDGHIHSTFINKGKHGIGRCPPRPLAGSKGKAGHSYVRFGRKGERGLVHRIIYEAFKGEIPEGLNVLHKDGNPSNNKPENLYAGTQKENCTDTVMHGRCNFSKLNAEKAEEIRKLRGVFMVKELAEMYGVRRQTITRIHKNKSWVKKGVGPHS